MNTLALRDYDMRLAANRTAVTIQPAQAAAVQSNLLPATRVHPIAIEVSLLAYAWLGAACWLAFGGGETSLIFAVILVLLVMYLGLLIGGTLMGRNMTPERRQDRGLREFLAGAVEIATGRVTGREAMLQIALLPIALAIGGTAIVLCAVYVGI